MLGDLVSSVEASYPDRAHLVWDVWEGAVGHELARRCQPLELRRGRLTVAACNPAWMQQLSFLRGRIQEALNLALGQELVREIRFRVAEVPPPAAPVPSRIPAWLSEPVEDLVRAAIDAEVAAIADPTLRETVRQVRVRAEQVRRHRQRQEAPGAEPPPPSTALPRLPPRGRGGGPGAT